jgi:hypothetical protein
MHLGAVMIRPKKRVRAELYLSSENAKAFFHLLREQRQEIEDELGFPLQWEELPDRRDSRIALYLDSTDPEDRGQWPRQHEWLATSLNDLHRVLAVRVRSLAASDWQSTAEPAFPAGGDG